MNSEQYAPPRTQDFFNVNGLVLFPAIRAGGVAGEPGFPANSEYPELVITPNQKHEYYKEKIVYLYYNLTRTSDLTEIRNKFDDLLLVLKNDIEISTQKFEPYLYQIYRLTLHTRDQFAGKGEHDVSYMLIDVLYKHFRRMALECLYQFVNPCYKTQALGSWRDIKYLCAYTKNEKLINDCINITNDALIRDLIKIKNHFPLPNNEIRSTISNIAKWIPRENKKFGWLFERLAMDWYTRHHNQSFPEKAQNNYTAILNKCKMRYRKLISTINKLLDTTEIKLCANQWNKLKIENIPQLAMSKYKASLCKYVFDSPEKILEPSFYNEFNMCRLECSLKTKKYFENKYYPEGAFDPYRIQSNYVPFSRPLAKIIKEGFDLLERPQELQIDVLNNEWLTLSNIINKTKINNTIPIIDMSFLSKQTDSYYVAIGLAILVAERSTFGRRILVIDNQLTWINIEHETTLFAIIKKIVQDTKSRISTVSNMDGAIRELVMHIDESQINNKKIAELALVYFHTEPLKNDTHNKIIQLFYKGGLVGSQNRAFACPKMVYWNLSQTTHELPADINSKNSILLSGHSANLISNLYCLCDIAYDTICDIIKEYMHPELPS